MNTSVITPLDQLNSISQVSLLLNTSSKQLRYLLYGRPESQRYTTSLIPKKRGGYRNIAAPKEDLKSLQRRFTKILYSFYLPRQSVHGFIQDHSILTNAEPHVHKRYIFNVDLENFFPSINFGRVRGLFMSAPFNIPEKGATILAQLCCHRNALPQVAPTSPIISNIICSRLDRQLMKLAQSYHCFYTRYADDMTFSKTSTSFPQRLATLGDF
jgi:RNA-directed DNA polymerase